MQSKHIKMTYTEYVHKTEHVSSRLTPTVTQNQLNSFQLG